MSLSQITCRLNVACDISMRMRPSAAEVWAPGGHELRDGASPSAWADVRYPPTGAVTRQGPGYATRSPCHPRATPVVLTGDVVVSTKIPRFTGGSNARSRPRVPGDWWPEEHVVAVSWIISGWVYVELRGAGAVARALPDPAGRGLGGGQVKRSRTCVAGAAGSGLRAKAASAARTVCRVCAPTRSVQARSASAPAWLSRSWSRCPSAVKARRRLRASTVC